MTKRIAVAALVAVLIAAALHLPVGRFGVTLYREIVATAWFDAMPLAARFEVLDRPAPFTTYPDSEEE